MDDKLKQIIKKYTAAEEINEDSDFSLELGFDSFQIMQLAIELEDAYGISLPSEEFSDVLTVGDLMKKIESKK